MKVIRKRSWSCPHCDKTLIIAEVETATFVVEDHTVTPTKTTPYEGKNTLRLMSESEFILTLEQYIEKLEKDMK